MDTHLAKIIKLYLFSYSFANLISIALKSIIFIGSLDRFLGNDFRL